MVEMVVHGTGIALLPQNMVDERIRNRELVEISGELPPEKLEFVIARHRDQEQAIIRHIVELTVAASGFLHGATPAPVKAATPPKRAASPKAPALVRRPVAKGRSAPPLP
jgi:hypothetical protein